MIKINGVSFSTQKSVSMVLVQDYYWKISKWPLAQALQQDSGFDSEESAAFIPTGCSGHK